jgi:hypothetical protein
MRTQGLTAAGIAAAVVGGLLVAGVIEMPAARVLAAQDQVIIQQGGAPSPAARGPVPADLAFEAASVKPNKSGGNQVSTAVSTPSTSRCGSSSGTPISFRTSSSSGALAGSQPIALTSSPRPKAIRSPCLPARPGRSRSCCAI